MCPLFDDFIACFKKLNDKCPELVNVTLGNILAMRTIGNKTHGDLAEIGLPEFVNRYMRGFAAKHVGKELYRSKQREEDIEVTNERTGDTCVVSLKAYGRGPLQLSTNKEGDMYGELIKLPRRNDVVQFPQALAGVCSVNAFGKFASSNILALIYEEKVGNGAGTEQGCSRCRLCVFQAKKALDSTAKIIYKKSGGRRKHPVFTFHDKQQRYVCEVRYGAKDANALQRGLWTTTSNSKQKQHVIDEYFDCLTDWIHYSPKTSLVKLLAGALVAPHKGHEEALKRVNVAIGSLKRKARLIP